MFARFVPLLGAALAVSAAVPVPQPAVMLGDGPGRNHAHPTEKGLPATWSVAEGAEKNLLWKARLGQATYQAAPVVAEGKVFVGTNNQNPRDKAVKGLHGVLMCFDAATGAFLWQVAHPVLDDPALCGAEVGYLASTPAVEAGKVYYLSNRAELVCAETARGNVLWKLDLVGTLGVYPGGAGGTLVAGSPLLLGDLVVVGTCNGYDDAKRGPRNAKAPSLVAVEKATGKVVWQDASPGNDILDRQVANPAAVQVDGSWQVVHGYGDGRVRGLDARTGALRWQFDANPRGLAFDPRRADSRNPVAATPVVHGGRVYVGVGAVATNVEVPVGVGHLWCIDPAKKPANAALDLSPVGNDFDPKSPKNKDAGLAWHHGGAVAPKPPDGPGRHWHFGRTCAPVAVHDGVVYAAESDGYLQALDAATGAKLWEADLECGTWASPYCADGKVYLGCEDGVVFVFQAGRAKKLLAKVEMDHPIRTAPVAANGVLYLSDGESLYALRAEK